MSGLYDLVRVFTSTTGTGTISLGAAVGEYLNFSEAGVPDGMVVSYAIEDFNSSGVVIGREIGHGTYSSGGLTLTRTVHHASPSGAASPISLSGLAQVFITPNAADFAGFVSGGLASTTASGSLSLGASIGATDTETVITTGSHILMLQITATADGPTQNYTLELFDGAPVDGRLRYQASGIMSSAYSDVNSFFIPALTAGNIQARATNIDADAVSITLGFRYLLMS